MKHVDVKHTHTQVTDTLKLLSLSGAPNDDIIIVLQCLDAMLTRRKKQVTLQRAMAFVKRLSTLSLHVLPNATVGILAASRATMHVSVCVCVCVCVCVFNRESELF